jgi:hypothetical protein
MIDETAVFEKLGSAGTMAFIWNAGGEADLRCLLETLITDKTGSTASRQSKEALEADAAELVATGFEAAANVVLEYVASVPTERELLCPYPPEDRANWDCWNASYDSRMARKLNPRNQNN